MSDTERNEQALLALRHMECNQMIADLRAQLDTVTRERDQAYKQASAYKEMLNTVCIERDRYHERLFEELGKLTALRAVLTRERLARIHFERTYPFYGWDKCDIITKRHSFDYADAILALPEVQAVVKP